MASTLKVYLVNMASDLAGRFDAARQKECSDLLAGYFQAIVRGAPRYNGAAVVWDGKQADPTPFDFVCYLLTSHDRSIIARRATDDVTLGPSGSTLYLPAQRAVISEVYLRAAVQGGDPRGNATPDAGALVANIVLHELGHNLLDASRPMVRDVHRMQGGKILRDTDTHPLRASDRPNEADNGAFREGFTRRPQGVAQYTGDMPA